MRHSTLLVTFCFLSFCLVAPFAVADGRFTATAELLQAGYIPHNSRVPHPQTRDDSATDALVAGLRAHQETISVIKYAIPVENVQNFYTQAINSSPDLFFVSKTFGYYEKNGLVDKFEPTYLYDEETSATMFQEMDAQADILLQAAVDCVSDTEKVMAIHDALILHTAYAMPIPTEQDDHAFNIYGALVLKRAVCQGYSLAILYLLRDKLGIPCGIVSSENAYHAWNVVQVNDKWYHMDATSDDPLIGSALCDFPGFVSHQHFLRGNSTLPDVYVNEASLEDAQPVITEFGEAGEDNPDAFWLTTEVKNANRNFLCFGGHAYYLVYSEADKGLKLLRSSFADNSTTTMTTLPNEYGLIWGSTSKYLFAASGIARKGSWILFNTMTAFKALIIPPELQTRNGEPVELKAITAQEFDTQTAQGYLYGFWKENEVLYAHCAPNRTTVGTVFSPDIDLSTLYPVTFTIADNEATVTGLSSPDIKDLVIPGDICGYPVTSIVEGVFAGSTLTSVTIPESIHAIGKGTFRDCGELLTASLPDSLEEIGEEAFAGCASLTHVTIPATAKTKAIGKAAFQGCAGLSELELPAELESIGEEAFAGCGLVALTLPDTVSTIGKRAFQDCAELTDAQLPAELEEVEEETFDGCVSLSHLTFPVTSKTKAIGKAAFQGCTDLTNVELPAALESIGEGAFAESGLTVLVLPDMVVSIGKGAFQDCLDLAEAQLPAGLEELGEEIFAGCDALAHVTFPAEAQTKAIGKKAFQGCADLTNIELPALLESIGEEAFAGCGLTILVLPEKVHSIGKSAFRDCANLTRAQLSSELEEIGEEAFAGCTSLTQIELPATLKDLPNRLFAGCSSLPRMTIDDAQTLGEGVFQGCTSLVTLFLGMQMNSIGNGCFDGCTSFTTIYTDNQAIIPRLRELLGYDFAIRPLPPPFQVCIQTGFIATIATRGVVTNPFPELVLGLAKESSVTPVGDEWDFDFSIAFTDTGVELAKDIRQFAENTTWTITATIPAGSQLILDWLQSRKDFPEIYGMPQEFSFFITKDEETFDMREVTNLELDNSDSTEATTYTLQVQVIQKSDAPTWEANLNAGWSLIGIPCGLKETSCTDLDAYRPMMFDQTRQTYVSAVQNYIVGQGLWLFSQTPVSFLLYGKRVPNPGVALVKGWNLVTPPYGENGSPSPYPANTQVWHLVEGVFQFLPPESNLFPGIGYLIYSNTPQVIW